jgi:hypothetical protein
MDAVTLAAAREPCHTFEHHARRTSARLIDAGWRGLKTSPHTLAPSGHFSWAISLDAINFYSWQRLFGNPEATSAIHVAHAHRI